MTKVNFWLCVCLLAPLAARAQDTKPEAVSSDRGSVTVDIIRGRGIAVGVDIPQGRALSGDGVFDRLVVLEAFGTIPPELPMVLRDAYVVYSAGRAMVVEMGGPRVVELVVDQPSRRGGLDDGRLPATVRLARAWSGADERSVFHGIGLVAAAVRTPVIDDGSWVTRPLARNACTTGSTSCSISCTCASTAGTCATSCTTTCSAGFYACCKCQGSQLGAGCSCLLSSGGFGGGGAGGGGGGAGGECSNVQGGCPAQCFNCAY